MFYNAFLVTYTVTYSDAPANMYECKRFCETQFSPLGAAIRDYGGGCSCVPNVPPSLPSSVYFVDPAAVLSLPATGTGESRARLLLLDELTDRVCDYTCDYGCYILFVNHLSGQNRGEGRRAEGHLAARCAVLITSM